MARKRKVSSPDRRADYADLGASSQPTPGVVYAEDEEEWLRACDRYRRKKHLLFLHACHYLEVAKSLGYRKGGG